MACSARRSVAMRRQWQQLSPEMKAVRIAEGRLATSVMQRIRTSLQVGPGSYTRSGRRIEHGYAPFSSTAERDLQTGPVTGGTYTPGPGYYSNGSASAQAAAVALHLSSDTNAPFHSTGSKFAADTRTSAAAPGPGAYSPASDWVKNTFRCAALKDCAHVPAQLPACASCSLAPQGRSFAKLGFAS